MAIVGPQGTRVARQIGEQMIAVECIIVFVLLLALIAVTAVAERQLRRNRKRGTWLPREWACKIWASRNV